MNLSLVLPIALLTIVLFLSPIVLAQDAKNRKVNARISALINPVTIVSTNDVTRSIRLQQQGMTPLKELARNYLKIPVDLPKAQIIPAWLVLVTAGILSCAALTISQIFVPLPYAIATSLFTLIMLPRSVFGWEHNQYCDKLMRQLPDAIELLVSATRAGLPISEAFRNVMREMPSPTRDEFSRVINDITLGAATDEALMNVHFRTGMTEYAIFAVTLGVQGKSGGRLTETVQNLADIIRQRITIAGKAKALAAEAKLSSQLMTALPFAGGIMMSILHPGYLNPLFTDPRGRNMFVVGVITLILGSLTMRSLIKGVTKE